MLYGDFGDLKIVVIDINLLTIITCKTNLNITITRSKNIFILNFCKTIAKHYSHCYPLSKHFK